jgi:hypothetical protein
MSKDDEFPDLAPLSLRLDPDRWRRMVEGVEAAAAPELDRRTRVQESGFLMLLSGWVRPAFAVAGALASAAVLVLVLQRPDGRGAVPEGVADDLGYPPAVSAWVEAGYSPAPDELLAAMNGELR